jgi:hypothetical protein
LIDKKHSGAKKMKLPSIKKDARKIIDNLPEDSSWEDLMHVVYVREVIEAGMKDSKEGRTVDVSEVRKKYGLD